VAKKSSINISVGERWEKDRVCDRMEELWHSIGASRCDVVEREAKVPPSLTINFLVNKK
jgi:hypothetical protein